jgi:hypothetical protein
MTTPSVTHEFEDIDGNELGDNLAGVDITHEVLRTFVDFDPDENRIVFTHRVQVWDKAIELRLMTEGLVHTGPSAMWCAICGTCTCVKGSGVVLTEDVGCPLHGFGTQHPSGA